MQNSIKKTILLNWLGLFLLLSPTLVKPNPTLPAARPPLEASLPIEQLKMVIQKKLNSSGDLDLSETFTNICDAIEDNFGEFVSLKAKTDPELLLNNIKDLLDRFETELIKTLEMRLNKNPEEKQADRAFLIAIFKVIHQDFIKVCTILKNHEGSTDPVSLMGLGSAVKPYKIRLPKHYRDYNVLQWQKAFVHRYSCKKKAL